MALAESHGLSWLGLLSTNGLLLDVPCARRLVEAGVDHVHVTVDGPARHHDRLRVQTNGGPTFACILENVRAVLRQVPEIRLTLRMNTTEETVSDAAEVLDSIPEEARPRVQFHATDVRCNGHVPSIEHLGQIAELTATALRLGFAYYDNVLPAAPADFCHADRPWHFQITPDGSVHRCSPAADKPEVQVGRLGPDGIPVLDTRDAQWQAAPRVLEACRSCPYLCFCLGGCRLRRLRGEQDPSCQRRFAHLPRLISNRYLAFTAKGARS